MTNLRNVVLLSVAGLALHFGVRGQEKQARPRFGKGEICIVNADGSGLRCLTDGRSADEEPEFSPDGRQIAFDSDRAGNREIYVMDTAGRNLKRLTDNPAKEDHAAWTRDGERIAFQYQDDPRVFVTDIFVMNADGTGRKRLTSSGPDAQDLASKARKGEPPTRNGWPSWSPDGKKIVFSSTRDGHREVYVMDSDGKNQKRLTVGSSANTDPSWSPDGRRIVFESERDGNNEIYVMNADGSNQVRLTRNNVHDTRAAWSADGRQIVYSSVLADPACPLQIWIMNADGSGNHRLAHTEDMMSRPNWSPDVSIVFQRHKRLAP